MSLHDKHRQRLDKKAIIYGFDMLEPHEQLEELLFQVIPRGDTNAIAHRLLERFVTIRGVINADVEELEQIKGVGHRVAMFLTSLPKLLGIVERDLKAEIPPKMSTTKEIADYVKTYFYGGLIEETYIFSLNSSYRLLAVNKISEGIAGEAYIFIAKAIKQAVRNNASIVVVVHNHPCGEVNPSTSDVELSKKLYKAFSLLDITLIDSIVVSDDKYFSLREMGYMEVLSKNY